ncbi:hypothetical protein ACQRBH_16625 [Bariatricus sp. SGI.161]|uniref:hypothetical protein n=1 Tax=Bariatricus sp. SGI.161 TaxID=3420550 RepID=UPI003CFCBF92
MLRKRMKRKRIKEAVGNAVTFTITAVGILLIWSAVQAIEDGWRITYGLLQMLLGATVLGILALTIRLIRRKHNEGIWE